MDKMIRTCERLDEWALRDLFDEKVVAIVVPGFCPPADCVALAHAIENDAAIEEYYYEVAHADGRRERLGFGVSRLGTTFNTTFGRPRDSEEASRYYQDALRYVKKIRALSAPRLAPIDKLRLELDEMWPPGAQIGAFEGRKMFVGVARITHPGSDTLEKKPHVDSLPPTFELAGQYSANIYLSVPESGGELVAWPLPEMSAKDIDDLARNEELWRKDLGRGIEIKPRVGDLILINTRKPHAVRRFDQGSRISLQSFIGRLPSQALRLWC